MKSALAAILALALSGQAAAQTVGVRDAEVRTAIRDYDALEYGSVIPRLVKSLSRTELTEIDRRAALAYLARSYAIFKRSAEAESTFAELLQRDPSFTPADSESPRIREAYIAAKARRAVTAPLPPEPLTTKPAEPTAVTALAAPAPPPSSGAKWLLVGGGVVVVAAVVVLLIWRPWQDDPDQAPGRTVPDSQLGRFDLP